MREKKDRGAMVVEATISLTAYIFVIFTILSIVDICYIQSKMAVSLNAAAKEISQYSYLYFKFGLDELQQGVHAETEEARETTQATVDGVGTLIDSATGAGAALETFDFEEMMGHVQTASTTAESLVTTYGDKLAEDPKGFIVGMGKMALEDLTEQAKGLLAEVMATALMKKNLAAYTGDNADAFLKRWGIEQGLDGLDFKYSTMMPYGTPDIILVMTYDVKVLQLLDMDYSFTFRQCAKTKAWGNGISKITPEQNVADKKPSINIWEEASTDRGKKVVILEKERFTYISSGDGFHAYNNEGGANEFVKIRSIDTVTTKTNTAKEIKTALSTEYSKLYSAVAAQGEDVTVKDASGNEVKVNSPKDTRTYKIVLVVPDNADMTIVNQAKQEYEKERADLGDTVVVEIRTGYGDAHVAEETEPEAMETEETE